MTIDVQAVRAAAGSVRDPEIRRSLSEMGLLDDVQIEGSQVTSSASGDYQVHALKGQKSSI